MYKVIITETALKNLKKLDKRYQKAVKKAIDRLEQDPKVGFPLKGRLKGLWKLRFSRYRIVYQIIEKKLIVMILRIGHRREVYR